MKKFQFKLLVFVCALVLSSCATVRETAGVIKKPGFAIDESKFSYVNWQVPHQKRIVFINNIYDGDTVTAGEEYSDEMDEDSSRGEDEVIRFLAVDTPEIAHPEQGFDTNEPGALAATEFTKKEVRGAKVILVVDPDNKEGVFGRTLALIFYKDKRGDMRCLNWELLKRGLAKENLWATDLLCKKSEWRNMAKLARLRKPAAFIGMGRLSLKEKFVYDALEFYQRGVKKFPSHADLRKD
ncbi:MAG: thermonuclease family protein, partial [Elusimicrobiota bacterium]|nr:thermonuclease family protein [Elusimicrobiota bacterium]